MQEGKPLKLRGQRGDADGHGIKLYLHIFEIYIYGNEQHYAYDDEAWEEYGAVPALIGKYLLLAAPILFVLDFYAFFSGHIISFGAAFANFRRDVRWVTINPNYTQKTYAPQAKIPWRRTAGAGYAIIGAIICRLSAYIAPDLGEF